MDKDFIKITKELRKKQNVNLVGRGRKTVASKKTTEQGVVIGVLKKEPKSALAKKDLVPSTIGGMTTDVVEVHEIHAPPPVARPTDLYGPISVALPDPKVLMRPILGGASIGHFEITAGTYTLTVRKNGKKRGFDCNHVLANVNQAKIGDRIEQPGPYDQVGTYPNDEQLIGYLSEFIPIEFGGTPSPCNIARIPVKILNFMAWLARSNTRIPDPIKKEIWNETDSALFIPLDEDDLSDEVLYIGTPMGVAEAEVDMPTYGFGRTDFYLEGSVSMVDVTANVNVGTGIAVFTNQVGLDMDIHGGDSGMAIFTTGNLLVCKVFAGSDVIGLANKYSVDHEKLGLDPIVATVKVTSKQVHKVLKYA